MAQSVETFLMFNEGNAEEAMNFYLSLFPGSSVTSLERFGTGEAGKEGSIKSGKIEIAGQKLVCFDSPVKHAFTFTPSVSLFVTCEDEAELDRLFTQLSENGRVLMPLDNYGFSKKFGWTDDRFGVSWQLNLP